MQLGLLLNSQAPVDQDAKATFGHLVDQVRAADEAGFEVIIANQHYLADYTQLQPIPLLARMAAETDDLRLGTGVIILPLHNPVEIAEHLATLSVFSDRRVVAGVAAGYRNEEFDAFDVDKDDRGGRMHEGVELLKRLWTEESVTYRGEHYAVEDATINPRPDEPPEIWYGANAKRAIGRAARIADTWYINPHSTITEIAAHKEKYDELRRARDLHTRVPMRRELFVADTTEEAMAVGRQYLAEKYQRYVKWGQHEAMEDETELQQPFDDLARDRFVLGTPAEVTAELERYEEELNVSHVIARLHWPGMPYDRAIECIERLGDDVIPAL